MALFLHHLFVMHFAYSLVALIYFATPTWAGECDSALKKLEARLKVLRDELSQKMPDAQLEVESGLIKIHTGNEKDDVKLEFAAYGPEEFRNYLFWAPTSAFERSFIFVKSRSVSSEPNTQAAQRGGGTFVSDRGRVDPLRGKGLSNLMTSALVAVADYWDIGLIGSKLDFSNYEAFKSALDSNGTLSIPQRIQRGFLATPSAKGFLRVGWQLDLGLSNYNYDSPPESGGNYPRPYFVNPAWVPNPLLRPE